MSQCQNSYQNPVDLTNDDLNLTQTLDLEMMVTNIVQDGMDLVADHSASLSMTTPLKRKLTGTENVRANIQKSDMFASRKKERPVTINNTCILCKQYLSHSVEECHRTYTLPAWAFNEMVIVCHEIVDIYPDVIFGEPDFAQEIVKCFEPYDELFSIDEQSMNMEK